jgi:hypothetical protein
MELNMTGDVMRADDEAGQNFVGFEVDRIAQRRVFEDDQVGLIKEQRAIRRDQFQRITASLPDRSGGLWLPSSSL